MSVLIPILVTFHVLVCALMVGVVLMQRPKNEGLGAAFGGGMTENIFGAQTTHVLQRFTVWLGVIFFALTLLLAILYAKRGAGETAIQKELLSQPAVPAAAPAASPAAAPSAAAETTAAPTVVTTGPVTVEKVVVDGVATTPVVSTPVPAPAPSPAPSGD